MSMIESFNARPFTERAFIYGAASLTCVAVGAVVTGGASLLGTAASLGIGAYTAKVAVDSHQSGNDISHTAKIVCGGLVTAAVGGYVVKLVGLAASFAMNILSVGIAAGAVGYEGFKYIQAQSSDVGNLFNRVKNTVASKFGNPGAAVAQQPQSGASLPDANGAPVS